jgi:hypothetical protein
MLGVLDKVLNIADMSALVAAEGTCQWLTTRLRAPARKKDAARPESDCPPFAFPDAAVLQADSTTRSAVIDRLAISLASKRPSNACDFAGSSGGVRTTPGCA